MAYTTPDDFLTGTQLTQAFLQEQIRNNLMALKDPPTDVNQLNLSDITLTGSSFSDLDATNLAVSIVTTGGLVAVGVSGMVQLSATTDNGYFNLMVNGSDYFGDDGFYGWRGTAQFHIGVMVWLSLTPGSYTIKLRGKVSAGTLTFRGGNGAASYKVKPQFWAREMS